jgi:hypothetical protein
MPIFKRTTTATLENSRYLDHFEFEADCVLWKRESRAQFFKIIAAMIEEYQPATFSESLQIASMASARWRQLRYSGMSAAVAASDWTDRARLLELLARWERDSRRSYNSNRKFLLELLARRVNNVGAPTRAQPAPVAQSSREAARSTVGGKLLKFPAPKPPIAA